MPIDFDQPFSLSIDKISLTCNDTEPSHVEETCHRLLQESNKVFSGIQVKSSRWHRLQCAIPIPNSVGTFLIQASSRHSDISDYRFEFNPSIIGPEGLAYASSFIDSVISTGASALFANAKITRIDIALDLPSAGAEAQIEADEAAE